MIDFKLLLNFVKGWEFLYLEVADGLLQRAVVVQHHASELQRLDVVLVQQESFLEALHR